MNITEFLEARIAEDEATARAAIDTPRPGSHWQWVTNETDTVVATGDLAEAQEYQNLSLRTVEEYPTSAGELPGFIIGHAEEVDPGAGEHIARHDPARVLAEIAAKRKILADRKRIDRSAGMDDWYSGYSDANYDALHALAAVYADHQDYQQEWAK